jgi:hypothetical protein
MSQRRGIIDSQLGDVCQPMSAREFEVVYSKALGLPPLLISE